MELDSRPPRNARSVSFLIVNVKNNNTLIFNENEYSFLLENIFALSRKPPNGREKVVMFTS